MQLSVAICDRAASQCSAVLIYFLRRSEVYQEPAASGLGTDRVHTRMTTRPRSSDDNRWERL